MLYSYIFAISPIKITNYYFVLNFPFHVEPFSGHNIMIIKGCLALLKIILVVSYLPVAIWPIILALSIWVSILQLPFVVITISEIKFALSIYLAILPLSFITITIIPKALALSMPLTFLKFPFIPPIGILLDHDFSRDHFAKNNWII